MVKNCWTSSTPCSAATCGTWALRFTAAICSAPRCEQFPDRVEICVVRLGEKPIAAGLLTHGWGVTEVPSASSLRRV